MPGARLELAQEFNLPTDFKSVASADSAIRADLEARGGIEPPYTGFADPCITTLLPRRKNFESSPERSADRFRGRHERMVQGNFFDRADRIPQWNGLNVLPFQADHMPQFPFFQ